MTPSGTDRDGARRAPDDAGQRASREQQAKAERRVQEAIRQLEQQPHLLPRSVLCCCGATIPLSQFRPGAPQQVTALCDTCGREMVLHLGR